MKNAPQPYQDEVLGTMPWDEDEGGWIAGPMKDGFRIVVGGTQLPDSKRLATARALFTDPRKVLAQVASLLSAFASRVPDAVRAEVSALEVDAFHLMWPDRPSEGMIYFRGPDPYRLWHCDYVAGVPQDLGFDD